VAVQLRAMVRVVKVEAEPAPALPLPAASLAGDWLFSEAAWGELLDDAELAVGSLYGSPPSSSVKLEEVRRPAPLRDGSSKVDSPASRCAAPRRRAGSRAPQRGAAAPLHAPGAAARPERPSRLCCACSLLVLAR
jgi:hypothetical protein